VVELEVEVVGDEVCIDVGVLVDDRGDVNGVDEELCELDCVDIGDEGVVLLFCELDEDD